MVVVCIGVTTGCVMEGVDNVKKSTIQGADSGAMVGSAVGGAVGNDGIIGSAVGTVVGGAIGGMLAYDLAQKLDTEKKVLEGKEMDLDTRIQYAQTVNRETKTYNDKMKADLKNIEDSINKEKADKKRLESTQEKLKKDVERVNLELAELQDYRKSLNDDTNPKEKLKSLDIQIQELQGNLAALEDNTQMLASLNKRIKV